MVRDPRKKRLEKNQEFLSKQKINAWKFAIAAPLRLGLKKSPPVINVDAF